MSMRPPISVSPMSAGEPLDYHTPAAIFLDPNPPRYGQASLGYGLCAAGSAYLFIVMRGASPFSVVTLLTFPLVAAIPIFGLTGVVRGVDAVALRRQRTMAISGLVLSLLSMVMLAHTLFQPF